jgi:hypothetical protein
LEVDNNTIIQLLKDKTGLVYNDTDYSNYELVIKRYLKKEYDDFNYTIDNDLLIIIIYSNMTDQSYKVYYSK